MFTGIITGIAPVKKAEKKNGSLFLTIVKPKSWKLVAGDSVNTNGVCLTVRRAVKDSYRTELMAETLRASSFGKNVPKNVNLERPVSLNGLLDGHIVQGHVDAIGKIKKIASHGDSKLYTVSFPREYRQLVVKKGSIAVDGISLTIVDCGQDWLSVALVNYTLEHTTLGQKKVGGLVNLEFDIIAKYVAQQLKGK